MDNEPNAEPNVPADGGVGTETPVTTWLDSLPDDLKGNEAVLAEWKDKQPGDVLKAHLELKAKAERSIHVPGEDAKPEEKQAFEAAIRKALGVPEKMEDYKLQLPEGTPADDPIVTEYLKAAHEQGLNTPQAQGVIEKMVTKIHEHREAKKLVAQESIKTLWKEKYDENLASSITGMRKASEDAGLEEAEITALAEALPTHPGLVRIFAQIGKLYVEDKLTAGGGTQREKSYGELFGWSQK